MYKLIVVSNNKPIELQHSTAHYLADVAQGLSDGGVSIINAQPTLTVLNSSPLCSHRVAPTTLPVDPACTASARAWEVFCDADISLRPAVLLQFSIHSDCCCLS